MRPPLLNQFAARWKQVLGGLLAAILLLPLPAFALTFNGAWTAFSGPTATGGAPLPTFLDPNADHKLLIINPGSFTVPAGTIATNSITVHNFWLF